jgi:hypothetical protein
VSSIKVTIKGTKELERKLGVNIPKKLKPAMNNSCEIVVNAMADYPPKPPQSTYRRTMTLGRRWGYKVAMKGKGIVGIIKNLTPYVEWVQSKLRQVRWMKHWQTDEKVIKRVKPQVVREFEEGLERLWK